MNNLRNSLNYSKGAWHLGKGDIIKAAEQFGTPLYLYDGATIKERIGELRRFLPLPELQFFYAMKANNNPHILSLMEKEGIGIDAVSEAEVLMALACGFSPDRIIYTANHITDGEMKRVHETGVLMNIGSLSRLEKYGRTFPGSRVCLRFNPDVVAGEFDKIKTGGPLTKFGILIEEAPRVREIADRYQLKIVGLHKHTGSGIADADLYLESMSRITALALGGLFPHLDFLDFGGGFKVPCEESEVPLDYDSFGKRITRLFSDFMESYGKPVRLFFEPGKYLIAEAGLLVIRVNTLKRNRERLIAGTDSGFPQLIRPAFYGAYHSIVNLSHREGDKKVYDITGNICESGDIFARDREIEEIREGDYLALLNGGAYCYAMGSTYNMRPLPAEALVEEDGSMRLIRRRTSPADLVRTIQEEALWN
ncbi:MAG: diaminopimelate decarboxylase [Spirochaetales bacterium]|nr:diaminopimelate decarboxylase [Spirochaetales bacterium]